MLKDSSKAHGRNHNDADHLKSKIKPLGRGHAHIGRPDVVIQIGFVLFYETIYLTKCSYCGDAAECLLKMGVDGRYFIFQNQNVISLFLKSICINTTYMKQTGVFSILLKSNDSSSFKDKQF